LVEIQAYQCSDIISYLLKLAWQLLWQMTAPIRYKFWSCDRNSLYTDYYSFVYILLCLRVRLNNINYSCWYFSSSVNHHILILNLWNTIQLKYHKQWVFYLWYNQDTVFIIVDVSIKNNITFSISHIHRNQEIITKSIHHNVTFTKAKLFTIRCSINYIIHIYWIVVIIDTILEAK